MLVSEFLTATARRLPDTPALISNGRPTPYAEVARKATALAATLQIRGVRRGDRVAIFMDNGDEAVIAIWAALLAGAVMMPINPLTRMEKLDYLLRDSQASALISHMSLREHWGPAVAANRCVHTVIACGDVGAGNGVVSYDAAITCTAELTDAQLIDQDLAAIIYTSGSTGEAKGVMLTHLNMVSAARSISSYLGLVESDIILCASPLAFDYGLYQVLMAFKVGASVVLELSFAFPVRVVEVMERERVTVLPGVPTMFSMLMNIKSIGDYDLRSLRLLTNTAAALSERHIRELRACFPTARLFSMYGLTECKRVTYLPPDQLDVRPTSVGRGMPNEEVWLVDEDGRRLPNGSTGELVIRGSHVMRGYWNKPAETAERLRPGTYPGETVLYSGDLFRTDAEGYLYFVARKDDIIKSRGEKVSPREVENALYGLPGVEEAAVVGVPDPVLGEAVKAFIALRPGYRYTDKEVIRHCLGKLETFMAPKYVEFREALPKTDTGKIKKAGLA
jgi:long-chain acyl-CoA synthetase